MVTRYGMVIIPLFNWLWDVRATNCSRNQIRTIVCQLNGSVHLRPDKITYDHLLANQIRRNDDTSLLSNVTQTSAIYEYTVEFRKRFKLIGILVSHLNSTVLRIVWRLSEPYGVWLIIQTVTTPNQLMGIVRGD